VPVVIEELTTTLEVQDEVKVRRLVVDEIRRYLREHRDSLHARGADVDPADPTASGTSDEG